MNDHQIIQNILNGKKDQYAFIMEKYHNELFTFVYNIVNSYQTTEDLLQEIFLKVYKNLSKYHKEKSSFRTWLYRISNNHTINYLNSKTYKTHVYKSEYEDYNHQSATDIEKDLIKEEKITQIIQAMKKVLKPKHQEIIALHYFSDLSIKEISEVTNIPEKTIYSAIKSSIEKIKEEVL